MPPSRSARAAVLDAIRRQLAVVRRSEPEPQPLDPDRAKIGRGVVSNEPHAQRAQFMTQLEQVGASVSVVADRDEAVTMIGEILQTRGVRRLAVSDDEMVQDLGGNLDVQVCEAGADRHDLLSCDAGLSAAQWGVAETGSLVLLSSEERHRLVSLIPPIHIAVLRSSRILGALDDALQKVSAPELTELSRAVTFVTGPSRTADIELTLVVGMHGPKELHVVLLEEG